MRSICECANDGGLNKSEVGAGRRAAKICSKEKKST